MQKFGSTMGKEVKPEMVRDAIRLMPFAYARVGAFRFEFNVEFRMPLGNLGFLTQKKCQH